MAMGQSPTRRVSKPTGARSAKKPTTSRLKGQATAEIGTKKNARRKTAQTKATAAMRGGEEVAELLRSDFTFDQGQRERVFWLPNSARGSLIVEAEAEVTVVAYDRKGSPVNEPTTRLTLANLHRLGRGDTALRRTLPPAGAFCAIRFLRDAAHTRKKETVSVGIDYDQPVQVFRKGSWWDTTVIHSPLKRFPGGEELTTVPAGSPHRSFSKFVKETFGYDFQKGIRLSEWWALQELSILFFPPAGHPGPTPPPGSKHEDNYCGISTFVHSMETKFPGSLKPDVSTNPTSWDEVGDNLDHSNTFGARAAKMKSNVNANYGGTSGKSANSRAYRQHRLSDTTPANLEAWAEAGNLKLLVYNFLGRFGHWVDVTAVTPSTTDPNEATLEIQDYGHAYTVTYRKPTGWLVDPQGAIDFSSAASGSVMGTEFSSASGNNIAGDNAWEPLGFSVTYDAGPKTSPSTTLPTTTASGKTLNQ